MCKNQKRPEEKHSAYFVDCVDVAWNSPRGRTPLRGTKIRQPANYVPPFPGGYVNEHVEDADFAADRVQPDIRPVVAGHPGLGADGAAGGGVLPDHHPSGCGPGDYSDTYDTARI